MTRREALDTEAMLQRLTKVLTDHEPPQGIVVGYAFGRTRADAESLRRISMTLHRWHELECGVDGGGIERDSIDNKPWWYSSRANQRTHIVPDREAGALKRLAAIMARYPGLTYYVQGDPRGCALYILPSSLCDSRDDPPAVRGWLEANYSRGLAVHQ